MFVVVPEFGGVFGIPLGKCIANDQELRRRKSANLQGECEETTTLTPRHARYWTLMFSARSSLQIPTSALLNLRFYLD